MDFLFNIDKWLFSVLNGQFINPVFDKFFPFITLQQNWNLLYIVLAAWLLWKGGKRGRVAIIILAVTIIISDQTASHILKPLIARLRPCNDLISVRLLINCGSGFSFPSSHAVNTFAAAFILSRFYSENKYLFYIIAALIAYSRVYVGVHYPSDVIAGSILGIIIAYLIVIVYEFLSSKIKVISVL
jgi:undecaprenyl-diphosphatase